MMQQTELTAAAPATLAGPHTLTELISALRSIDFASADVAHVKALVANTRTDEASISPFVYFDAGRYTRNGVFRDEHYELILMCWAAGARSSIHGHGGSRGFVKVCRGSLDVTNYTIVNGGREPGIAELEPSASLTMRTGDIEVVLPDQDVHVVSPHEDAAISLHLYAKPLDRYLVYDIENRSCRSVTSRYDTPPHR